MYCGSCLRDNALAAELKRQRHEVLLVPLYTPTLTDEKNVSERRVFFGGVSVYLEQKLPMFRNTPKWLDRVWDSPRVLNWLSGLSVSNDPKMLGEMTVSVLRGEDGNQRKEFVSLLEWLRTQPRPDIVSLHDSLLIRLAAPIKQALGCPVVCTLQGEDLFLENMAEPWRSQSLELVRAHLGDVDAFISISEYYAAHMSKYLGIPPEKIRVIPLGVNLQGYGPRARLNVGPSLQPPLVLGFLTRIAPEKGLHTLCEAYRILRRERELPASRLEVAGYLAAEHKSYLRRIERRMKDWGFAREFEYHGQPDRDTKIRFFQRLSVFSIPGTFPGDAEVSGSHFPEPKGLPLIEAMACGVPAVQLGRGTSAELVEKTGGGILVNFDPSSAHSVPQSIADGIYRIWNNPALAEQLGRRAAEGARSYSAERMASRAIEVYSALLQKKSAATHAS